MDQTTLLAVAAILQLIEKVVIPLLVQGDNQDKINSVIDTLEKLLPAIGDQIGSFVAVIKNIIAALSSTPGTPAEQLARLQALDSKVDADFEAAAAAVDPDAPASS